MSLAVTLSLSTTQSTQSILASAGASGGTPPYLYRWSGDVAGGAVGPGGNPTPTLSIVRAGILTVTVGVLDSTGATADATATVTVPAIATTIILSLPDVWGAQPITQTPLPPNRNGPIWATPPMAVGATLQFDAAALDQFGNAISNPVVQWYATGGTIDSTGLFTAAAAGPATITAACGVASAAATVAVAAVATMTVVFGGQVAPSATQTVVLDFAGCTPRASAPVTSSAGTVNSQTANGPCVSVSFTAPSTQGSVVLTDPTSGATASVVVSSAAPPARHISFLMTYRFGPCTDVKIPADVDNDLVWLESRGTSPSVIRADTGAGVGPSGNVPFLRKAIGAYYFDLPDIAPEANYVYNLAYLIHGIRNATQFYSKPPSSGQVTTLTLTSAGNGPSVGMSVLVSSDPQGSTVVGGPSLTNSAGQVVFELVSGTTYYLFASGGGELPIVGQAFVAAPDAG